MSFRVHFVRRLHPNSALPSGVSASVAFVSSCFALLPLWFPCASTCRSTPQLEYSLYVSKNLNTFLFLRDFQLLNTLLFHIKTDVEG